MSATVIAFAFVFGILFGSVAGFWLRGYFDRRSNPAAGRAAQARRADADREVQSILREAQLQAKTEVLQARETFEASTKEQRRSINESMDKLNKREETLAQREGNLDRRADMLDRKEEVVDRKSAAADAALAEAKSLAKTAEDKTADAETRLARLSGMTREEARKDLYERARTDIQGDVAAFIRRSAEAAKQQADSASREIVLGAMQRYVGSHAAETMLRAVPVTGADVKGRIIGREGRNIRSLESVTGCSILIDDTPDAILVSSADPVRREVAARAIEILIASGRLNPQRIEEVVASVQGDMNRIFRESALEAADKAGVAVADEEELLALGRLKFRTSYTQNVLLHSIETACYAGMMAAELGLDETLARRIGLFHDIGKALDQQMQGPHAAIGGDFLRAHSESADVVNGVAGHHGEVKDVTLYAVLASVADAMSSARPGARAENTALYVNRIEKLEQFAMSVPGVSRAFAVQAGRDLRVIVDPDRISDDQAVILASELSGRIEQELQYPGQIRVTVIREKRCIEYAR